MMKTIICGVALTLIVICGQAATVWTGPNITVTKADGASPTLPPNQDRLNNDVWLTRGNIRGLYNIKSEASYGDKSVSPAGTRWAFLGVFNPGDPAVFTAANHSALTFDSFANALGGQVGHVILNRKGVLHLVAQDIYLDIKFTAWTQGPGGGFSYIRSTPENPASDVPLPPWALLILGPSVMAAALLFLREKRA